MPNCNWKGKDDQPLPLHDCKAVVRFLRNNGEGMSEYPQNIDTSFITIGGFSTGGLIATMMGMQKWGNFEDWYEGTVGNFTDKSSSVDAVASWSGFYVGPEELASYSYILNNIAGGDSGHRFGLKTFTAFAEDPSPEVVFHGYNDGVIRPADANFFYTWLQDRGADSEYYLMNGQSHGLIIGSSKYYYYGYMVNFFDRIRAKKAAAATAVEQIGQDANAKHQKLLIDGHLLIEHNGKTYNAQGAEVQ